MIKDLVLWLVFMAVFIVAAAALSGCTREGESRRVLESSGFTEIKITGWKPFACSKGDDFQTGFTAINTQGQLVEGVVCCGILKSCTIRF